MGKFVLLFLFATIAITNTDVAQAAGRDPIIVPYTQKEVDASWMPKLGSIRNAHPNTPHVGINSQKNAAVTLEKFVIEFESADRAAVDQSLTALTLGKVKTADISEFQNKESPCLVKTCAVVTRQQLDMLTAYKNALPKFKAIGKKTVQSFARNQSSVRLDDVLKSNRSSGSAYFTAYNPDPNFYYIPDLGYQELGAYLPLSALPFLTATSEITSTWYQVNFYHSAPSDLVISIGYDDTAIGGSTNVASTLYNHPTGLSGFFLNTLSGTTTAFNGYYPDSYFYIGAQDTYFLDDGYLDSVAFEVYWQDLPDLKMYTGAGSSFYWNTSPAVLGNGYIDVDATAVNNSYADVVSSFDMGWYVTQAFDCSFINHNINASNTYFVGYQTYNVGLMPNSYAVKSLINADLFLAVNSFGSYAPAGTNYCLWAYVDDTNAIYEYWENNNTHDYGTFYFNPLSSVRENRKMAQLSVYPNPTVETLNIVLPDTINGKTTQLEITNLAGQLVRSEVISGGSGNKAISVSELSPGTYIAKLKYEGGELQNKFIKK